MASLTYTTGGDNNLTSFKAASSVPITSLKAYFKPKQDLHGYSRPWPAGGGKNLLNVENATPTGTSFILSEGTVTLAAVGSGNGSKQWFNQIFPAGTYTISAKYSGNVSGVRFLCDKELTSWTWNDYYNGYFSPTNNLVTFTASESFSVGVVFLTLTGHVGESGTIYEIQLETGSTATSYEPYENICPIEGWNNLEIDKTGKSIAPFTVETKTITGSSYYNGYSGWSTAWKIPDRTKTYIYSAYIDNTNCDKAANLAVWFRDETNSNYVDNVSKSGSSIPAGSAGISKVVVPLNSRPYTYYLCFGISAYPGAKISNPMVEIGDDATDYESYQGQVLSITFPVLGKNLLEIKNDNLIDFSSSTYNHYSVSNNMITTNGLALFGYKIQCLPSTVYTFSFNKTYDGNTVLVRAISYENNPDLIRNGDDFLRNISSTNNSITFETKPTSKWLVCSFYVYNNAANETINLSNLQLEYGNAPTTYEAFSSSNTVYGGYVDPVAGELVAEWRIRPLSDITFYNYSGKQYWYCYVNDRELHTDLYCDKLSARGDGQFLKEAIGEITYYGPNVNSNYSYCFIKTPEVMEQAAANTWIQSTYANANIVYKLATPITYRLISSQNISTSPGENNVWSTGNDVTELSYGVNDSHMMRAARRRIADTAGPSITSVSGDRACYNASVKAPIPSLKVNFSPIQDGEGDPSISNMRPITGWNEFIIKKTGRNLAHVVGYSATTVNSPLNARNITNSYGTTLNTINYTWPDSSVVVTQSQTPQSNLSDYRNGYMAVIVDNLQFGKTYNFSIKVSNITSNPLNATLQNWKLCDPSGSQASPVEVSGDKVRFRMQYKQHSVATRECVDFRICGMSFTLSEFMVTEADDTDITFEPYRGQITPVTFGIVGKNLFDEIYPNINGQLLYKSIYVGNQQVTASSNMPKQDVGWSNLFILPGRVTSGASTGLNDFNIDCSRTVTPVDGYVTVAYRESANLKPNNYNSMIESGSYVTTYEPYTTNSCVYGGYIDIVNGEIVATHKSVIFNGTEPNWSTYGAIERNDFCVNRNILDKKKGWQTSLCDKLTNVNNAFASSSYGYGRYCDHPTIRGIYICMPNSEVTTLNEFKSWLSENPIQLVYELDEPIHYSMTPQVLKSFSGPNSIWSTANGDIEVEYWTHVRPR